MHLAPPPPPPTPHPPTPPHPPKTPPTTDHQIAAKVPGSTPETCKAMANQMALDKARGTGNNFWGGVRDDVIDCLVAAFGGLGSLGLGGPEATGLTNPPPPPNHTNDSMWR